MMEKQQNGPQQNKLFNKQATTTQLYYSRLQKRPSHWKLPLPPQLDSLLHPPLWKSLLV